MVSYVIFTRFESDFLKIMVMNPKNHLIPAGVLFMFLVTARHWFEPVLDGYLNFFWKKLEIEESAVGAFGKVGIKELQFQTF